MNIKQQTEKINYNKQPREENPFEDEKVAAEWINSIENERGQYRDTEIYPRLADWLNDQAADKVVDIGSGQGICSDKLGNFAGTYLGIEPSAALVKRAKDLYPNENRSFIIGEAYHLPIESDSVDAAFSIMVWFHLEDLGQASAELARILKPGGNFMIVTANPDAPNTWESFYFDYQKDGKKITGKVNVPINPLSKNIYYHHSLEEILQALRDNKLAIMSIENYGIYKKNNLFVSITGEKPLKK